PAKCSCAAKKTLRAVQNRNAQSTVRSRREPAIRTFDRRSRAVCPCSRHVLLPRSFCRDPAVGANGLPAPVFADGLRELGAHEFRTLDEAAVLVDAYVQSLGRAVAEQ